MALPRLIAAAYIGVTAVWTEPTHFPIASGRPLRKQSSDVPLRFAPFTLELALAAFFDTIFIEELFT
jgi:hypothetical protein